MARNIKNPEVERSTAEAADLTRAQRIDAILAGFHKDFPLADFGRKMTKAEEEEILGFDPD